MIAAAHTERRLVELHIEEARARALRVFAIAGSVFPEEWSKQYDEVLIKDLMDFAFHARRINQLCDFTKTAFPSIKSTPFVISENDPGNWEENYHFALNRLVHITKLTVGHCHTDHRRLFLKSSANLNPMYVKVTTDERQEVTISIFGLVFCFLNFVVPEIRKKFPSFMF